MRRSQRNFALFEKIYSRNFLFFFFYITDAHTLNMNQKKKKKNQNKSKHIIMCPLKVKFLVLFDICLNPVQKSGM